MKKVLLLLLAIAGVLYVSCKKTDKDNDGPGEVYGKWKLTETMQDPGDGSGRYKKVSGQAKYLILSKSADKAGKFEGDALPDLFSFRILDSVKMEVYSNTYKMPMIYQYKVSAKSLQLNPPCFEGCGYRFVRE
ncbi:hypothetical protein J7E50_23745 [Pedobacter sp. ISL-68]|uniref:hypothetical protein n=1 Tax=unclassified Pedobacter TaxID=2628915 RepID=UPI001BE9C0F2|nr:MULTISPECIES: hypothetical protein [unclassified Pedobacter]MBT2560520.1 hypothetical protein [Pedobacter sp. ISL-64]MBT2593253.1 hypothetical protein [Pedobacter sp. ISL-68]